MKVSIYILMHPITNEVRYVGKTQYHPNDRLLSHIREINKPDKKNYHSKNWIRSLMKEGLIPMLEVVETCDQDNWAQREIFWISYYKGIDCDLTNMTEGGDGGPKKMPETWKNPKNIPVDIYTPEGIFVKTTASLKKAERYTGCHNGKISAICKGKDNRNSGYGYTYRYKGDPFHREKRDAMGTRVFVVFKDLSLFGLYKSSRLASEATEISDSFIRCCCAHPFYETGERRGRNGLFFFHEKEYLELTDNCGECKEREVNY